MRQSTVDAVRIEEARAVREHGQLTTDHVRAFVVLSEEIGEVAEAVLEIGRAERLHLAELVDARKRLVVEELVQVIAVASMMVDNLERDGV